jgi:uncharacterized protein (TIGR02145 family)
MKKIVLALMFLIVGFTSFSQQTGSFKDPRDGKVYQTVKIGTQWIMSQNLAFKPSLDIFSEQNGDTAFVSKYGYLYNWESAKSSCPKGWHLPSKNEWETLFKSLGGDKTTMYEKMKEGGSSGFNARLSGFCDNGSKYLDAGKVTFYWSSTPTQDRGAYYFRCGSDAITTLFVNDYCHGYGHSVRLFKDK